MDKTYKEYKVIRIDEGLLGTLFLGSSKIPIEKVERILNDYVRDGWQVVFQIIERKRTWLFWERESLIVTLAR